MFARTPGAGGSAQAPRRAKDEDHARRSPERRAPEALHRRLGGRKMKIVRVIGFAVLVGIVAASPLFAGNYPVKLLQEILIWGIFAMSLDLLMGYAGMVSFGHSAFFGVGGYVAALSLGPSPCRVSALLRPPRAPRIPPLLIALFPLTVCGG